MKRNINGTIAKFKKNTRVPTELTIMKRKIPLDSGVILAVLVIDIAVAVMFWYMSKTIIALVGK